MKQYLHLETCPHKVWFTHIKKTQIATLDFTWLQ